MTETGMIRGLIFDFDGTIVDTELPAYQAWQEIFEEHGCSLPLVEWAQSLGGGDRVFDPCLYLETQLGRTLDHLALRERRQARKLELRAAVGLEAGRGVQFAAGLGRRTPRSIRAPRILPLRELCR
jgi:beta-phosphoglucomutase-like phosphatase (HAD superfamily)